MIPINHSVGFLHIKSTENEIEQQSVNPLCESLMINKALVKLNLSSKTYKKKKKSIQKIIWEIHSFKP